jgi:ligand-binding sensor domain-containing protein
MRFPLLCILLISTSFAAAQRPFGREYWLNDAATPVHINTLAQDASGYIWLGTDAGLYRYNGNNFILFEDSLHVPVTALGVADNGIWAGFKNGAIARAGAERSLAVIYRPADTGKAITSIVPTGNGNAVATTEDRILAISAAGVSHIGAGDLLPEGYIYSLIPISAKRALLASDAGLTDISYQGGRWSGTTISSSQGLPDPILRVASPIPRTTLYWLGTQESGIALYSAAAKKVWVPFCRDNWMWGQVNDILPISQTRAYAATESGYLLELSLADSLHLSIKPHFFPGKELGKMLADRSGNLWCATGENLLKISALYAQYIPLGQPFSIRSLTAMTCDQDDNIWMAQDNRLYLQKASDTGMQPRPVALAPSSITSLYADKADRLWIGTLGNGLLYLPYGSRRLVPAAIDALRAENILNIAGTPGSLWLASLSSVYELSYPDVRGGQTILRRHTKASGIGTDYVYQIYPDSKGLIWMATDGAGVAMYNGAGYRRWDDEKGIKVAYAITEDANGDIWAATLEKGLYCLHAGAWRHYGREEGLQETSIASLSATGSGIVVAVNRQGIDQWYPGSRLFRHINRRMGIDIDSTSSVLNCIARDNAGNVYVPFEHGIIKLYDDAASYDIKPAVRIAQVGLFMSPVSMDQHEFASDENQLSFFFDGLNYANPEPLNYRYKLEGYNNSWIPTGDNRVTFSRLPPGDYTFRLQGSLNQHFSQSGEAIYHFHIASPLWRRAWFIALFCIVLGLLAWYLIRLRDKSVNNLLRLRQERLAFEYEHLKTQVNPHFLFNSLNTLTSLIEDKEVKAAATYTAQLSDLYRNMLAYRDQDLILLSEELGILEAYLHIQHTRFEDAFEVKVDIPAAMLHTKKIIPMALQLLVENAIKHNVVSKSNPLVIRILADDDTITISNTLQPKVSPQKGSGLGLEHIRRRYELLTSRKISFGPNNGLFVVSLPLL